MADENDHEGRGLADRSLDLTGEARPSDGIPVNTLMTIGRRQGVAFRDHRLFAADGERGYNPWWLLPVP
jgi:hypothetical protein